MHSFYNFVHNWRRSSVVHLNNFSTRNVLISKLCKFEAVFQNGTHRRDCVKHPAHSSSSAFSNPLIFWVQIENIVFYKQQKQVSSRSSVMHSVVEFPDYRLYSIHLMVWVVPCVRDLFGATPDYSIITKVVLSTECSFKFTTLVLLSIYELYSTSMTFLVVARTKKRLGVKKT